MCQLWALHVVIKQQFFYIYEKLEQVDTFPYIGSPNVRKRIHLLQSGGDRRITAKISKSHNNFN